MAALEEAKAALSEANSALERPSFPEPNWFELCNVQIIPGPSPCYLVQINDNYNYCGPPEAQCYASVDVKGTQCLPQPN